MKKLISFGLIFLVTIGMAMPAMALAEDACHKNFLGFPHWYEYLTVEQVDGICQITGPASTDVNPGDAVKIDFAKAVPLVGLAVLDILLRFAGLIAFVFIVYSGFKFVLAQGDSGKEKEARETIINAVVGMVIAMSATAIVTIIGNRLSQ